MIAQLLLAVLVIVMFGLAFKVVATCVSGPAGHAVAFLVDLRESVQRPWLTGLGIVAISATAAICLWAWVSTVNLNVVNTLCVAIGFATITSLSVLVMRNLIRDAALAFGKNGLKLRQVNMSGWVRPVKTRVDNLVRSFTVAHLDTRRDSLNCRRFSVITHSGLAPAFLAMSTVALLLLFTHVVGVTGLTA